MKKIPKIVHYCWFGDVPIPRHLLQCISSWKEHLEGYEFKHWNNSTIQEFSNAFVEKAIENKKWAYVSDVARIYALTKFGGVYLDTDMLLTKNLDCLLLNESFIGQEGEGYLSAGVIGSIKNLEFWNVVLDFYQSLVFDPKMPQGQTAPGVINMVFAKERHLQSSITVLERDVFYPYPITAALNNEDPLKYATASTMGIHLWDRSWWGEDGKLFNLFWRNQFRKAWSAWCIYVIKNPFRPIKFYKNSLYHLKRQLLKK